MERNNPSSFRSSWADQWDYNEPTPMTKSSGSHHNSKKSSNAVAGTGTTTAKYKQKVGEGLEKTKAVASTGVKKLKQGTSLGIHWIKDKYHKTTHKQ